MRKPVAEKSRDIDFSGAQRGAMVKADPGKTKISIRLDNAVLEHFRAEVDRAGGGNYQTLINEALRAHIARGSALDVVRQVVREELGAYGTDVPALRTGAGRRDRGSSARALRPKAR
jgi:uncharacterized protein (DUF4415 family)